MEVWSHGFVGITSGYGPDKSKGSGDFVLKSYSTTQLLIHGRGFGSAVAQLRLQVGPGLCVFLADGSHGAVLLDEGLEVGIGAVERGLFRLIQSASFAKVPV